MWKKRYSDKNGTHAFLATCSKHGRWTVTISTSQDSNLSHIISHLCCTWPETHVYRFYQNIVFFTSNLKCSSSLARVLSLVLFLIFLVLFLTLSRSLIHSLSFHHLTLSLPYIYLTISLSFPLSLNMYSYIALSYPLYLSISLFLSLSPSLFLSRTFCLAFRSQC